MNVTVIKIKTGKYKVSIVDGDESEVKIFDSMNDVSEYIKKLNEETNKSTPIFLQD